MATVSLRGAVEELDALDDEAGMVEDDVDPDDMPDWLGDEMPKIREVLESDDWLILPTKFDIHEWAIMDEFARSIGDDDLSDQLMTAIRGRGAFRCFKDAVHRRGIQQDWYCYRDAAIGRIVGDWLDEQGVPWIDDLSAAAAGRASNKEIKPMAQAPSER